MLSSSLFLQRVTTFYDTFEVVIILLRVISVTYDTLRKTTRLISFEPAYPFFAYATLF